MTDPTIDTRQEVRDFAAWLCEHDHGATVVTASHALAEAVIAAVGQCKKSTLTLKVVIDPTGAGGVMQTTVTVDTKLPQPDPAASIFFADSHGGLHRQDPRQMTFDPRTGEVTP